MHLTPRPPTSRRKKIVAPWLAALALSCGGGELQTTDSSDATSSEDTTASTTTASTTTSSTTTSSTTTSSTTTSPTTTSPTTTDPSSTSETADTSDTGSSSVDTGDDETSSSGSTGEPIPVSHYGTYLGESGLQDQIRGAALDDAGNIYFIGGAYSPNLACDGQHAGSMDAIVGRIDADGGLAWCRYIGGTGYDRFYDIEVSSDGSRVVLAGRAGAGFPTTVGAWDSTFAPAQGSCGGSYGTQDGGVCSLNADDGSVGWCTYTGFAGGCDFIRSIALDANDDVILGTGYVGAATDPEYDAVFLNAAPGGQGGIVGRLSSDGETLLWYRYVGGVGTSAVEGMVAVDAMGIYYSPAWTRDATHTVVDGFDDTYAGMGTTDIYLARVSLDGTSLDYATYAGGGGGEDSGMHGVMPSHTPGVVFVKVLTTSLDFPTSEGAISTMRSGASDCGVVKIDTTANGAASFVAGTYLGGTSTDFCEGAAWVPGIGLALSGITASDDFPVSGQAWQPDLAGSDDGWVAIVSDDLTSIVYASYMGGSGSDSARAIDAAGGVIAIVGMTESNDFPVSADAHQAAFSGGGQPDGFVARIPW